MSFPAWKYHKDASLTQKNLFQDPAHPAPKEYGAKIFHSKEELDAAGEGWVDSPSKLSVKEAEEIAQAADLSPSLDEEIGKAKPKKGKK